MYKWDIWRSFGFWVVRWGALLARCLFVYLFWHPRMARRIGTDRREQLTHAFVRYLFINQSFANSMGSLR